MAATEKVATKMKGSMHVKCLPPLIDDAGREDQQLLRNDRSMIANSPYLTQFADLITSFEGSVYLTGEMLRRLTVAEEGNLSMVWAPLEHICESARVVIVGITPGATQAENAHLAFRNAMAEGLTIEQALRRAKLAASFSGRMRGSLVRMLDHIGLHQALQLESCAQLFREDTEYAHFTSALRYPVFRHSTNYNGNPDMLQTPMLRRLRHFGLGNFDRVGSNHSWHSD